jgi:dihydrodipicolinate reductase
MNVLLCGATGMIDQGVLRECLRDPGVRTVVAVGRSPSGQRHEKLRDVVSPNLMIYPSLRPTSPGSTRASSASEFRPWG